MGTLFWRGTFDIIGSPGNPDPCGSGLEYAIDRDGLYLSGVFPNGWSQLANGFWRFDTPLATGYDYSVILYTPNTSSGCWGDRTWSIVQRPPAVPQAPPPAVNSSI
ncbi:MAG: hypothetical protein H6592_06615 [Flavobacteriales bacterium]|nr:hypothetical protein [Flavobacteriales bacterium]